MNCISVHLTAIFAALVIKTPLVCAWYGGAFIRRGLLCSCWFS